MFDSQRSKVMDDPPKKERRSWNRVPIEVGVFCQNVQGQDELCWSARVVDISRGGMQLLSPHRFDPNTTIRIGKADGPEDTSEFWREQALQMQLDAAEEAGGYPGITMSGALVVVPADAGARLSS